MRDNDTITRNARVDGKNFALGKNVGHIPSSLGGRSIGVGGQAVRQKMLQFDNFNSAISKA